MAPHHNWTDGYHQLRRRIEDLPGVEEVDAGTDRAASWPRSTNNDVLAIAAVIDPALAVWPARYANEDVNRRWFALRDDFVRALVEPPGDPYARNREFWSTVAAICTHLDQVSMPELWSALAEHVGDVKALRNAGPREDGPFAHFEGIQSYDDMALAQRKYLAEKRGSDRTQPPAGFGGGESIIPRTNNADVLQLATYWSDQLAKAKQVMGYATAVTNWKARIADVDVLAKGGKPDAVYPKNKEFWRTVMNTSIQIAIGDEAPSKWDMAVDSLKYSVGHIPQTLGTAATKTVDFVAGAGRAAGHIANEVGKGLFAGFGTPLLIGGGLIGLYLISRSRDHAEE
jgi:hypothetical protein